MPKDKKIYYIYKIHFLCGFPTGRYYIGRHECSDLSKDRYTGSGSFCKAYFKKYGKEEGITYLKEIIEINPDFEINRQREEYHVGNLYYEDPLCMNMIKGGVMSCEVFSLSTRDKISKALKGNNNGKNHKASTYHKTRMIEVFGKKVIQYSLEGKEIARYDSIHDAANKTNIHFVQISECCRKRTCSAKGYIWRFAATPLTEEDMIKVQLGKGVGVIQYNKDGIEVARYNSLKEASEKSGISLNVIKQHLCGLLPHTKSFTWVRINPRKPYTKSIRKEAKKVYKRSVTDWSILKIYDSIADASRDIGICTTGIKRRCLRKTIVDDYYLTMSYA